MSVYSLFQFLHVQTLPGLPVAPRQISFGTQANLVI